MKKFLSVVLSVLILAVCLTGCGGPNADMTEENITETVNVAFTALKEFDTKALNKYVDSPTLSTIMSYAEKHQQFKDLGIAIFENLEYEIKEVNVEEQTVTISVKNKELYGVASAFAGELKRDYNTFQLLSKLSDDSFLDLKLSKLTSQIAEAKMIDTAVDVTLSVTAVKKNLVLSFDSYSEDAVSGDALSAIKSIYGLK